jgi:hypothetical protein
VVAVVAMAGIQSGGSHGGQGALLPPALRPSMHTLVLIAVNCSGHCTGGGV